MSRHPLGERESNPTSRQLYTVAALFSPVELAVPFSRAAWPPHVTLVGNFATAANADEVVATIGRVRMHESPFELEFGGRDLFGADRDIAVQLVVSEWVRRLHDLLVDELERLDSLRPESPTQWRDGFRPHLTLRGRSAAHRGERATVTHIVVARLQAGEAEILAEREVPQS